MEYDVGLADPPRPVLRYHGGKWILAPWIISHFPAHRVYVEPYGGAASVLLRKTRSYAEVYNDLDSEIVNLFRVLGDFEQARELVRQLRLTPYARTEFEASYLVASGDPIEQARRTVIRSFMGFSSASLNSARKTGFRANANRSGSSPAHDWCNYPKALERAIERFRGVVIESRPAIDIMWQQDSSKTLYYVDPPYPTSTRSESCNRDAYRYEMTNDDHRELAAVLHNLQGMVVISGYPSALYDDELFPTWQRVERMAYADGARERTETLWLSPRTTEALNSPVQMSILEVL